MTKSVMLEKLDNELTAKMNAYVKAYNGREKKAKLKALKTEATVALKKYNEELAAETYRVWNGIDGNPVLAAVRTKEIPDGYRLNFKTDDDDEMTGSVKPANIPCDFFDIQDTLGNKVFADPQNWTKILEQLMVDVILHLSKKADTKVSVETINGIATASETKMTDKEMVKRLQEAFDAILVVPDKNGNNKIKAGIESWTIVRESMTKGDGETVEICGTSRFAGIILKAMHVICTNGTFKMIHGEVGTKSGSSEDEFAAIDEALEIAESDTETEAE